MIEKDIIIAGAGPVGLCLAASLVKRGVDASRIVCIDAKKTEQSQHDPRAIALNIGSIVILNAITSPLKNSHPIGIPIHHIHVSRQGHFGRTLIHCEDHALPFLGMVMAYDTLVHWLSTSPYLAQIQQIRPAHVVHHDEKNNSIVLSLSNNTKYRTRFFIQAEGSLSPSNSATTTRYNYEQSALVTTLKASHPIPYCAFERFTQEGPLALLPYPSEQHYALVWCASPEKIHQLYIMDEKSFSQALHHTFGERVGQLTMTARREVFPLHLSVCHALPETIISRTIRIGNAAQTLHPVAGQGLNLGLRDAFTLARLLAKDMTPSTLSTFIDHRQRDRTITIQLTDALARLFSSKCPGTWTQSLLTGSLGYIDMMLPAKKRLSEHMMFGWR